MPTFKYRVRDRSGKAIAGTIEAPTLQMAGDQLYQLGYFPISIQEAGEAISLNLSDIWMRFQKVKSEELIVFSQQLSTLYKAGLPLLTGLESIAEQIKNDKFRGILKEIRAQIEGGSTLHGAMARYPEVFSPIYVNMVRAGETSGMLGESLDRFVTLADRELTTRKRVNDATRYPLIVVVTLVIAFVALVYLVIPRFAEVFAKFNTTLPLPTRIMIGVNTVSHTYWYLVLFVFLGIPIIIWRYLKTRNGKYFWHKLKIQIPGLGPIFLKIALSRFAYTFAMLNRSGIPILQTLEITSATINNMHLSQSIEEISRKVREGSGLADAMRESGKFTPLVLQMISVGETTGGLDGMLMRVAEYYDIEVDNAIKKMSTYIEPVMTLFLGFVVLFLALAVFLPWWNMASLFR